MSKSYPPSGESYQRNAVMLLARTQTEHTKVLTEILWLTNAHPYLTALPQIAINLEAILSIAQKAWGKAFEEYGFTAWLPALAWIGQHRREIMAATVRARYEELIELM